MTVVVKPYSPHTLVHATAISIEGGFVSVSGVDVCIDNAHGRIQVLPMGFMGTDCFWMNCPLSNWCTVYFSFSKTGLPGKFVSFGIALGFLHGEVYLLSSSVEALTICEG